MLRESYRALCPALMLIGLLGVCPTAVQGSEPVDFMRQIRPILSQNCFMCHGPDESSRQAGLRLDRRESALAELESGAFAIRPGDIKGSELLVRLVSEDEFLKMPPPDSGRTITREQIALVRRWIEEGAPYEEHWSFQPPESVAVPPVADTSWPRNEIDHFVLARLEQAQIAPSPEADGTTLIRRLFLDLLGLPPTPEDVDAFMQDLRPDAYERLVDRVLASPEFGERWGRHWLDVARYADSDGYLGDDLRPNAWRYRDWVIGAINDDLPFDEFTVQQLAGDLLPNATIEEKIATGFHRNSMKNTEAGADRELDRVARTVDRVSTTGTVWLGLTLGCAQCHSHKFDPISHAEFYQMYAFFDNLVDRDVKLTAATDPDADSPTAPTIMEAEKPRITHVHLRGDFRSPGEEVQPATLAVLHPLEPRGSTADRLDLARWLVDPANPLTPRTAVNRVWLHLFGRGLVSTVDDFGTSGEAPSHPELLDWLARKFSREGWSRKRLIRRIVTSATYRQSSRQREDLAQIDPFNIMLARQARFRVEAEVVRDVSLSASGLLERAIGGPSIRPVLNSRITSISRNKDWKVSPGSLKYRRGMYILFRRATPYPMLTTFDAPDSTIACPERERSNSPLQSLTLLNDAVFFECAQHLGRRLASIETSTPDEWIIHAYRLCLGRPPTPDELIRSHAYAAEQRELLEAASRDDVRSIVGKGLAGTDPSDDELRERAVRVALARVLMNLDEFITRE